MKRLAVWFGVLLIWILPSSTSRGDLLFEFGVGGVITSNIEIPGPGATVPIQVYLRQTGTTTILEDEGLDLAAIRVTFDDPAVAAVLDADDIATGPGFDLDFPGFTFKTVTSSAAGLGAGVDFGDLPVFPDADGRILLGTFTFTGLTLGTTTIRVSDWDPDLDDIITGLFPGTVLDDLIHPASATLTVTPEPGSVALSLVALGGAAVVGVYRSRRKRRKMSAEDPSMVAG